MSTLTNGAYRKAVSGIALVSVLIVSAVSATGIGIHHYLSDVDPSTINISLSNSDNTINRIYGTTLDLSKITITYQTRKKEEKSIHANETMVSDYDSEYIGKQSITITYHNVSKQIFVNTIPASTLSPTLMFSNQGLSWSSIPNVKEYQLNYGTSPDSLSPLCTSTDSHYDLSSFEHYGHCYFSVKALKESNKYYDSDWSNILDVYNVGKVTNITYESGVLSWQDVEGADSYTVEINDEKHSGIKEAAYHCDFSGGNYKVKIYAYSNLENSLYSESDYITYTTLNQISNVEYSNDSIHWDNVVDADFYDIYVNDDFYMKTETATVDVSAFSCGIYDFKIIAHSNQSNILDSLDYSFKALINYKLSIDSGIASWDELPNDNCDYYVVIDGVKESVPNESFAIDLNSYKLNPGYHSVQIQISSDSSIEFDHSDELMVCKLKSPSLSIENNQIICDDSSKNLKLFLDGFEFDGCLSNIDAGNHTIIGKYCGTNNQEIDSDETNLNISKLKSPTIWMNDSILNMDDPTKKAVWYLDDSEFNGNASAIPEGTHSIYAKYIGSDSNTIHSDSSNILTITRYPVPILSYESHTIQCKENNINVRYYLDGVEFSGDYSSISNGKHTVCAKNIGDGSTTLDSSLSDTLTIYKSDAEIVVTKLTNNRLNVTIKTTESELLYDMQIDYYNNDNLIDTQVFTNTSAINSPQTITYKRNGTLADMVIITVSIKDQSDNLCDQIITEYSI